MSTKQDKKVNPEDSLTSEEGWINVEEGRHDNLRYHKEPDRYFMLSVQSAAAPIELLALLGTIRKGKDWELLGFNPYTWRTGPLYHWACSGQGYVDIDGNRFNFSAHFAGIDRKWHKAITSGKRFVEHAFEVYWLRKLGVEFDEMVNLSEHTKAYAEARLAFEREDFLAAIGLAKRASELHPKEFNYIALFYQARRAAGDLSVIDEEMHYYRHDMEGAIHAGYAERWIKMGLQVKDQVLVFDVVKQILQSMDPLIKGKPAHRDRVFSGYDRSFCIYVREKFIKRLGTMRGFLTNEFAIENAHRNSEIRELLCLIAKHAPNKAAKISNLVALLPPLDSVAK